MMVGDLIRPRPRVGDLTGLLTCTVCTGYLVDATAITQCLHAFCRSCIVQHLKSSRLCPVCNMEVLQHGNTADQTLLRSDHTLQTLVYKLVPDLFENEMRRRRKYYRQHPMSDADIGGLARGDGSVHVPHVFTCQEHVHVRLHLPCVHDASEISSRLPSAGSPSTGDDIHCTGDSAGSVSDERGVEPPNLHTSSDTVAPDPQTPSAPTPAQGSDDGNNRLGDEKSCHVTPGSSFRADVGIRCSSVLQPPCAAVRFLRCTAITPLSALQKLVRLKLQLPDSIKIQLVGSGEVLPGHLTLADVGYVFQHQMGDLMELSCRFVRMTSELEQRSVSVEYDNLSVQETSSTSQKTSIKTSRKRKPDVAVDDAICNKKHKSRSTTVDNVKIESDSGSVETKSTPSDAKSTALRRSYSDSSGKVVESKETASSEGVVSPNGVRSKSANFSRLLAYSYRNPRPLPSSPYQELSTQRVTSSKTDSATSSLNFAGTTSTNPIDIKKIVGASSARKDASVCPPNSLGATVTKSQKPSKLHHHSKVTAATTASSAARNYNTSIESPTDSLEASNASAHVVLKLRKTVTDSKKMYSSMPSDNFKEIETSKQNSPTVSTYAQSLTTSTMPLKPQMPVEASADSVCASSCNPIDCFTGTIQTSPDEDGSSTNGPILKDASNGKPISPSLIHRPSELTGVSGNTNTEVSSKKTTVEMPEPIKSSACDYPSVDHRSLLSSSPINSEDPRTAASQPHTSSRHQSSSSSSSRADMFDPEDDEPVSSPQLVECLIAQLDATEPGQAKRSTDTASISSKDQSRSADLAKSGADNAELSRGKSAAAKSDLKNQETSTLSSTSAAPKTSSASIVPSKSRVTVCKTAAIWNPITGPTASRDYHSSRINEPATSRSSPLSESPFSSSSPAVSSPSCTAVVPSSSSPAVDPSLRRARSSEGIWSCGGPVGGRPLGRSVLNTCAVGIRSDRLAVARDEFRGSPDASRAINVRYAAQSFGGGGESGRARARSTPQDRLCRAENTVRSLSTGGDRRRSASSEDATGGRLERCDTTVTAVTWSEVRLPSASARAVASRNGAAGVAGAYAAVGGAPSRMRVEAEQLTAVGVAMVTNEAARAANDLAHKKRPPPREIVSQVPPDNRHRSSTSKPSTDNSILPTTDNAAPDNYIPDRSRHGTTNDAVPDNSCRPATDKATPDNKHRPSGSKLPTDNKPPDGGREKCLLPMIGRRLSVEDDMRIMTVGDSSPNIDLMSSGKPLEYELPIRIPNLADRQIPSSNILQKNRERSSKGQTVKTQPRVGSMDTPKSSSRKSSVPPVKRMRFETFSSSVRPLDLSLHPKQNQFLLSHVAGVDKKKTSTDQTAIQSAMSDLAKRKDLSFTPVRSTLKPDSSPKKRTAACVSQLPFTAAAKEQQRAALNTPELEKTPGISSFSRMMPQHQLNSFSYPLSVSTSESCWDQLAVQHHQELLLRNMLALQHMAMTHGRCFLPPLPPSSSLNPGSMSAAVGLQHAQHQTTSSALMASQRAFLQQQAEMRLRKKTSPLAGCTAPRVPSPPAGSTTAASFQRVDHQHHHYPPEHSKDRAGSGKRI